MKKNLFLAATLALGLLMGACSSDDPVVTPVDDEPEKPIEATVLKLTPSVADLEVGDVLEIQAMILPEDAEDKTIAWSSSNTEIATVSPEGVVTALARGSVTITAELGKLKSTSEINVWNPADEVIESTFLSIRYWGDYYETGIDNFSVEFGTVEYVNSSINSTGDFFLLSANNPRFENITAAYLLPGIYTFDNESPYEEMTLSGRQESLRIRYEEDANGDEMMEEIYNYFKDAYLVIAYDEVEQVCTFTAEMLLDNDELVRVHYRGSVVFTNTIERLIPPQISSDLDFVSGYGSASHYGDGTYMIDLMQSEDAFFDNQTVYLVLDTKEPNNEQIKAGTYPVSAEPVDGGYLSNGYYDITSGSAFYKGSYAYIMQSDYSQKFAFINEGTLTISYEGENMTIELEAKDLGGHRVHTIYTGAPIQIIY